MSKPVRVIVCRVDKETGIATPPTIEELPADPDGSSHLAAMQNIVGGLVECVGGFDGRGTDIWCNEEGLLLDLPLNRVIRAPMTEEQRIWASVTGQYPEYHIHGDFLIARVTPDGELESVNDLDVAYYTDVFRKETL